MPWYYSMVNLALEKNWWLRQFIKIAIGKIIEFIAINTAAIPNDLLEAELFGFEKGAFTGANAQRKGKFEQANQGTLFLDEIGDMPIDLQTRLLRVLSEGTILSSGRAGFNYC